MLNTYTSYQLIARDIPKAIDRVEAQPTVERETKYYLENIAKVKTIEEFVKDDRLFKYAMKAHGLKDMDYAKAFMVKALKEGVADKDSFANKLTDKRYAEFVDTYNFALLGDKATSFNQAQQGTVDKYLRQTLEENAGTENEGVRLALYFQRKAPTITSFYQILADPALGKVLRTALALPESFATADLERQVALFESRLDIEDISDPTKAGEFLKRFTSLWEIQNPSSPAMQSAGLLFGAPVSSGVSTDLLFAMQKLRF